ncbi:universal stress protein [Sulfitobacter aestuariivivens]|uniref:Universal stress protein n=1 Tax=Sulfitobacter aestuariivivens TaxID=2766981 RepID=A0A927D3K5_9RHOB|nr:universal stress protein [Sulfitobacter aestuariivivens]MBD3664458.1 universal stress protein [Sulfitobacter aestuariivivens]
MFTDIVVGFDGSEPSQNALKLACDLAKKYDSKVHVSHTPKHETVAFALGAVAGYHAATTMPKPAEIKEAAEKVFATANAIAKEAGQDSIETHQGEGDPAHDMLDVANAVNADLIVTGRRGLGNMGAMMLGSTSAHVAHHAKCACLTVA